MKIQILISKKSWATKQINLIKKILSKFDKNIVIISDHKNLRNNYDINIIFSYFKIIEKKYLNKSKKNIVIHASNLPYGRGMSPLTWQILKGKTTVIFTLIEANEKMDEGKIYYKKKIKIPKDVLFNEIKKIQLESSLGLIFKFLGKYKKTGRFPVSFLQKGSPYYFKLRTKIHSKLNINKSIRSQFNHIRVCDPENYPSYFIINKKKFVINVHKEIFKK
tara:strand:+ start:2434 stop:3093 length:660 start_codon:yes stop_codon:yes gene_type:complete